MNEIEVWRKRNIKYYQTEAGIEAHIFPGPTHYWEDYQWKEYNSSLVIRPHYGWERLCLDGSPMKIRIGDNPATEETELVEIAVEEGHWITIKATGIGTKQPDWVCDGNRVRWNRLYPDCDLEIEYDVYGKLSRKRIFYSPLLPDWKDSILLSSNLYMERRADGSVLICTPSRTIFIIHPPYLESQSGDRLSRGISYQIEREGRYEVLTKILSDEARAWIDAQFQSGVGWVLLDPTITVPEYTIATQAMTAINMQKNLSTGTGQANLEFTTAGRFAVGVSGSATANPLYRLLLKCDITDAKLQEAAMEQGNLQFPRGAKFSLLRAYLQFYHIGGRGTTPATAYVGVTGEKLPGAMVPDQNIEVRAYRVLKNWTTSGKWDWPDTGQPSWDGCPNDGTNATLLSSDDAIWVSSTTVGNALTRLYVTADVQGFLDSTYTNYGWVIRGIDEAAGNDQLIGLNSPGSTNVDATAWNWKGYRPVLVLEYALPMRAPTTIYATPRSTTAIDLNTDTVENREEYTIFYARYRDTAGPGAWTSLSNVANKWTEIVKLRPRERAYAHASLTATKDYGYIARHYNEQRSIGWPSAPLGQTVPNNIQSNAEFALSFSPSAVGTNTVTLPSTASSADSYYNGWEVYVYSGTGVGQAVLTVSSYVGATRVATLSGNWATAPTVSSVIVFRPYIPPSGVDTVAAYPSDGFKHNYDYKVAIAATDGGGLISTIRIYRKYSFDTAWGTAIHTMSPPQTAKNASSVVNDSSNLNIWFSSLSGYPINIADAAGAEQYYWTVSCNGGWSEFVATVTIAPAALDAFSGTYTVGGASRDIDFDEFTGASAEGLQDTRLQGPAEQQYVTLEGVNYAYDPIGVYITGVKDMGLGTTLELVDIAKTDYTGGNMTTDAVVDTSYIQTARDTSVTSVNQATFEVRTSDTPPSLQSSWASWITNYGNGTAWSDKSYPHWLDAVWGLDGSTLASHEVGNGGYIKNIVGALTVVPLDPSGGVTTFTVGVQAVGDGTLDVRRGFLSMDISEISIEELSDQAILYMPVSTANTVQIYVVDWGNPLASGAYSQASDYGVIEGLIYTGSLNNNLSDVNNLQTCTVKSTEFRNCLRRAIRDGKKYLRLRIQAQAEGTAGTFSTVTPSTCKIYYKLFAPYTQILDAQRLPSHLRKRYAQVRTTLWRGQSTGETP
jgi:hypothetical protein